MVNRVCNELYHKIIYHLNYIFKSFNKNSSLVWTVKVFLVFFVLMLILASAGYLFAISGQNWFIYIWDNWILYLYSAVEFQHIWWIIVAVVILLMIILVQPWIIKTKGGWRGRLFCFTFCYIFLYTLSFIFAWKFHRLIFNLKWPIVLCVFIVCHFFSLFTLGLLNSITNKIFNLNKEYIEQTKDIILTEDSPNKYIFYSSIYTIFIKKISQSFINKILRLICLFVNLNDSTYIMVKKFFIKVIEIFSFTWLFDNIFGGNYYVMHFEMILNFLINKEEKIAWNELIKDGLHPALMNSKVNNIFTTNEDITEKFSGEIKCFK